MTWQIMQRRTTARNARRATPGGSDGIATQRMPCDVRISASVYGTVSDFSWSQLLGALVMINAQLFRALVNAGPNNAQIIGADNGRPRADIDHIITQLFS